MGKILSTSEQHMSRNILKRMPNTEFVGPSECKSTLKLGSNIFREKARSSFFLSMLKQTKSRTLMHWLVSRVNKHLLSSANGKNKYFRILSFFLSIHISFFLSLFLQTKVTSPSQSSVPIDKFEVHPNLVTLFQVDWQG